MAHALIIVESPAKARTISRFLGDGFEVESSIGHIRDLPGTASEIPAKHKGEGWARLGVDVEHDFRPLYIIPAGKKKQVDTLRKKLKGATELYLATDEDREGEAIAWHLVEVLKPAIPVKRLVFHEITRAAIAHALEQPRSIDDRLVAAQEARRILDRLVGYEISPVLWRKLRPKLSAGRVQSVATRLIVAREEARMRFVEAGFSRIEARFAVGDEPSFSARIVELDGCKVAEGKDFDPETGRPKNDRVLVLDSATAAAVAGELGSARFTVDEVKEKPFTTRPYPPFMTSTLQQEAARKLRFNAQRTMRVAQSLYENGYITYMRTDSVTLSGEALHAARAQVGELYGDAYLPDKPRYYTSKSKAAQEAHEAIRPAGERFRTPKSLAGALDSDQLRLYELIWKRTLASQMPDAAGVKTDVAITAPTAERGTAVLATSGKVITFPGFLRAYVEGTDDPRADLPDRETLLPRLAVGQVLEAAEVSATDHATQPAPRYTEATLVKELEARGIGRPSTYASIIQTIQDRGYVWHKGQALVPTFTAIAVVRLLERHLPDLVDYDFTARMEDELDAIASGQREPVPWLRDFYFGGSTGGDARPIMRAGLQGLLTETVEGIHPKEASTIPIGATEDGLEVVVRIGRWGPYVQLGEDGPRATVPDELAPDELSVARALDLVRQAAEGGRNLGNHPESGDAVLLREGRYGPYVQLGENGGEVKPRMASLWPGMSPDGLTLDDAVMLLSYPREIGRHPETGEVITARVGRYGPYVSMGSESRSLPDHDSLRDLTVEAAVALLREPKKVGRRAAAALVKQLGPHPAGGASLEVRTGRYGPYVTDGTVNATVPKGVDPEAVTLEQAVELIAQREAKLRAQGKDPRAKKPKRAPRRRK
ncbi:MAG: type I DNA topoisomerase [Thermoanaerobaculales bacterium]|jgi:DNA topoisomerase-1|nr:type I DNA topoisomerase [Thermoanaerobaculales bacterium]